MSTESDFFDKFTNQVIVSAAACRDDLGRLVYLGVDLSNGGYLEVRVNSGFLAIAGWHPGPGTERHPIVRLSATPNRNEYS